MAEDPSSPESGPLSQLRKSHAACCLASSALPLTIVIHE